MTSATTYNENHRPNIFLERLKAGPVPVPPGGLSPEDKRGFGSLNRDGLVRVVERDGQTFLELGKGNYYEEATPAQQTTLDRVWDRIRAFRDLDIRAANESLVNSAQAHFNESEIAPGVREIPFSLLGPLLEGYDTPKEIERIADLAENIKASGEIEPLFVGLDPDGSLYIMEGQHRARALLLLGYDAVPARLVVDMDEPAPTIRLSPRA
jgi:hypothetical protein